MIERREDWPEIVATMYGAPLSAVAATLGVTPGALAAAWRRTQSPTAAGDRLAFSAGHSASDALPPEAGEGPVAGGADHATAQGSGSDQGLVAWKVAYGDAHERRHVVFVAATMERALELASDHGPSPTGIARLGPVIGPTQ